MEKKKLSTKELSKKFIPTIKNMLNYFKKSNFNNKIKLLGEIVVLILLLCILKLPFSIVRDMIINAFFSVEVANILLMNMLYIVFGLPYYILAIYLFVKTIVTRYEDLEVKEESKISNTDNTSDTSNTSPAVSTDNMVITSNSTIEESKEVANILLQSIESNPNANSENQAPINNEQENNIDNS